MQKVCKWRIFRRISLEARVNDTNKRIMLEFVTIRYILAFSQIVDRNTDQEFVADRCQMFSFRNYFHKICLNKA